MKSLWAIQTTCINDDDSAGMTDALRSLDIPYQELRVAPFSQHIPDVYHDGPIIPYGGTNFIDRVSKRKDWCCWFNENFTYATALKNYGEHMLNHDAQFMKIKDFSPSAFEDDLLFIRPDKDLKEFAGDIFDKREFTKWIEVIDKQGYEVHENTEILVASASRVDFEWRVFVVDGKAISASQYRKNHILKKSEDVPEKVFKFVEDMYKVWHPAKVFVMDVCAVDDDLAIMEVGDFHSAGWYYSDKAKIMKAINDFACEICIMSV